MNIIMIKYGELNTKGNNRKVFIDTLYNNIKQKIKMYEYTIKKDRVRMYIETIYINEVVEILKNIFGIYSIVIVKKANTKDIDDIKSCVYKLLSNEKFNTFKVKTNRADKNYMYDSMQLSKIIGGHILKNIENIKVDVHNPDITVNIDLREEGCFLYLNEIKGLCGYPSGVAGSGLLMLSGGIDSPVAGFLALKRGISLNAIYFASPPHTSIEAQEKVITLVKKLCKYTNKINLYVVPFTKIQEEIYKNNTDSYIITILRRMMYRISEKVCKNINSKIIINGESVGQVASQTLSSLSVINEVTNFPIIRPVSCLDKLEIIDIAKKIDTYNISILPYEDCCTIFLPKNPVINPKLDKAVYYETLFDYNSLIDDAINNIKKITITDIEEVNELL